MAKPRNQVVAEKAIALVSKGNKGLKFGQLLSCLNGRKPKEPRKIKSLIRSARITIENTYGLCVCPVSKNFFEAQKGSNGRVTRKAFSANPPKNREDANKCLPGGNGNTIGLYFPESGKDDLIYKAFCDRYGRQGMKLVMLSRKRVEIGLKQNVLLDSQECKSLVANWFDGSTTSLLEKMAARLEKLENKIEKKKPVRKAGS